MRRVLNPSPFQETALQRTDMGAVLTLAMSDTDGNSPKWIDIDRKRGIITPSDRRFLSSQDDYEGQESRTKRYRIRERLANGLYDFVDLRLMPSKDMDRVFSQMADEGPVLIAAFEVLYTGIAGLDRDDEKSGVERFEDLLESAIKATEHDAQHITNADVTIEIERTQPDFDDVREKVLAGQTTLEEFIYFMDHGPATDTLSTLADRNEPVKIDQDGKQVELLSADRVKEIVGDR